MNRVHCFHLWHYLVLAVVLIGLVAWVIPPSAVKADSVVTFPDSNLEAAVREAIELPSGDIYQSDLDSLTVLEAYDSGIADITGMEHCNSLTELNLSDNEIGDISHLSGLTNLWWLILSRNQIADLSPLSGLINLTCLDLDGNQISDLSDLSGLRSLTYLRLGRNRVSDLSPLSDLPGLWYLVIGGNQISDFSPISGLTSLSTLGLSDSDISDLSPLSGLTSLTGLGLNNNQISDVSSLAGLTNLTYLCLEPNQISNIEPLVDNPGLATGDDLYLRGNPLNSTSVDTWIPALQGRGVTVYWNAPAVVTFPDANLEAAIRDAIGQPTGDIYNDNLTSLETLDASSLGIVDLTGLEYCTSLTSLSLATNQISDISPLTGLTGLTGLDLSNNQISDLSPLSGLTSLTNLDLYINQIGDITPLSGLTSLTHLYLVGNLINDISPLSGLTSLTNLDLVGNLINDISPLSSLTSLTHLYLMNNQISDTSSLSSLTNLTTLLLGGNQIGDFSALSSLTGLTALFLDYNEITNVSPVSGLTSLTWLYLNNNQISDVSPVSGLTSLTNLNLASNQISNISPLSGLISLTYLDLDGNQISDIEALVDNSGMASGDVVYLRGNPLNSTSVDTWIPALEGRGVSVWWDTSNDPPNQPSNVSPAHATSNMSLTPTLQSSAFSDPDDADTHAASQWQVTTVSDNYASAVFDISTDDTQLISITVPALSYSTTYYWHVRHQDNHGAWSNWSAETSFTTVPTTPLVATHGASSITVNSARLYGRLTSLGSADNATVSFIWGTNSGTLTNETTGQVATGAGVFYFDLGSLTPGATYYYQAKAVGDGTSYGDEASFTTLPPAPLVATNDASIVTTNSARLNGDMTSLGTASSITISFLWGTISGSYPNETTGQAVTSTGTFHFDLAGLAPGTTYYYRAKAVGDETGYGAEESFVTITTPPVVATNDGSNLTTNSARLNGDLTSLGTAGSVTVSFVWGTSPGSLTNETAAQAVTHTGDFYFDLTGLTPGTTYYYKAKAVGHGAPVYGAVKSYTTGQSPELESLDPAEGKRKQQLKVTISGENLDGVTGMSFGPGIDIENWNAVSSSEITVEITIDAKAAKGTRGVSVTTVWGSATKTDGFTVVGGGGGVCSGGALAAPGVPSEMATVLAALGILLGIGYLVAGRSARDRRDSVRA